MAESTATSSIVLQRTGAVVRLTLNRPERHNALDPDSLNALADHCDAFAADPELRLVVLTGAGQSTFCSGADLSSVGTANLPADLFETVTGKVAALPQPTLAALNGNVFGGGVDLALACDFRLGVSGSRIRIPAVDFGLCYPPSSIARITRVIGEGAAKQLLVLGRTLEGDALLACGFADLLVDSEDFSSTVDEWIGTLSQGAPLAQQAMKAIVNMAAERRFDERQARSLARQCARSKDLEEGLAARREKRQPRFLGT